MFLREKKMFYIFLPVNVSCYSSLSYSIVGFFGQISFSLVRVQQTLASPIPKNVYFFLKNLTTPSL